MKETKPEKEKIYKCYKYGCGYKAANKNTLCMHAAMKHGGERPHTCQDCGRSFAVQTQLNHHIINHHGEADISCRDPDCTMMFKAHATHMTHFMRHHVKYIVLFENTEDKKIVRCMSCGKTYKKNAIHYHVSTCNIQSPFHENNRLRYDPEEAKKTNDALRNFDFSFCQPIQSSLSDDEIDPCKVDLIEARKNYEAVMNLYGFSTAF